MSEASKFSLELKSCPVLGAAPSQQQPACNNAGLAATNSAQHAAPTEELKRCQAARERSKSPNIPPSRGSAQTLDLKTDALNRLKHVYSSSDSDDDDSHRIKRQRRDYPGDRAIERCGPRMNPADAHHRQPSPPGGRTRCSLSLDRRERSTSSSRDSSHTSRSLSSSRRRQSRSLSSNRRRQSRSLSSSRRRQSRSLSSNRRRRSRSSELSSRDTSRVTPAFTRSSEQASRDSSPVTSAFTRLHCDGLIWVKNQKSLRYLLQRSGFDFDVLKRTTPSCCPVVGCRYKCVRSSFLSLRTHLRTIHKLEAKRCVSWQCFLCRVGKAGTPTALMTHLKQQHNTMVAETWAKNLLTVTDLSQLRNDAAADWLKAPGGDADSDHHANRDDHDHDDDDDDVDAQHDLSRSPSFDRRNSSNSPKSRSRSRSSSRWQRMRARKLEHLRASSSSPDRRLNAKKKRYEWHNRLVSNTLDF